MKRSTVVKTFSMAAVTLLALGMAPTAKAQDKGCSSATLRGTYAYTSSGSILAPPEIAGPIAEVGTQIFDGNGGTTATATISANGTIVPLTITGTYTVSSDCTGTATLQVSPFNATVHVYFVVRDNGNEFQAIETESGFVITRLGQRLYPGRII